MFLQYLGRRARVKGDEFPGELHVLHGEDYGCRVYQSARHQLPSGWLRFVLLGRRLTLTLSLSLSLSPTLRGWNSSCMEGLLSRGQRSSKADSGDSLERTPRHAPCLQE